MVGTVLSQKPRCLQWFRNESGFARSDAEQRPDHTETSWSDSVEMSWPRRTLIMYSKLLHDVSKLFTWSVTLSWSLSVMPRTLAQLTRSTFGHGSGGWNNWPHFSRMKISSFDFVRFSLRLFLDAQMGYFTQSRTWVCHRYHKVRVICKFENVIPRLRWRWTKLGPVQNLE